MIAKIFESGDVEVPGFEVFGNLEAMMTSTGKVVEVVQDSNIVSKYEIKELKSIQYILQLDSADYIENKLISRIITSVRQKLKAYEINGIFIKPTSYGSMHPNFVENCSWESVDDQFYTDWILALTAIVYGIPILGSCHGAQLLWRILGGKLVEATPTTNAYENFSTYKLIHSYDTDVKKQFIRSGERNYQEKSSYQTYLNITDGYSSDEEDDRDYDHNLLMLNSCNFKDVKKHPLNSHLKTEYKADVISGFVSDDKKVIGLQWRPHKQGGSGSGLYHLLIFFESCILGEKIISLSLHSLTKEPQKHLQDRITTKVSAVVHADYLQDLIDSFIQNNMNYFFDLYPPIDHAYYADETGVPLLHRIIKNLILRISTLDDESSCKKILENIHGLMKFELNSQYKSNYPNHQTLISLISALKNQINSLKKTSSTPNLDDLWENIETTCNLLGKKQPLT